MLPAPLMCTSVRMSEACREDSRDMEPAIMMDRYGPQGLSFVVDGGVRVAEVSTVRPPSPESSYRRRRVICRAVLVADCLDVQPFKCSKDIIGTRVRITRRDAC